MSKIISRQEWEMTIAAVERHDAWENKQESRLIELIQAVRQKDKEWVDRCLQRGAPINMALNQETTALAAAAAVNDLDMVDFLLKRRASPSTRFSMGRDAAWIAMEHEANECFEMIINQGAPASIRLKDGSERTRLIEATLRSNTSVVRFLAYKKINLNEYDAQGRTALHHNFLKTPYETADIEIARILLNLGGDPYAEDENGIPPMALATQSEQLALLEGFDLQSVAYDAMMPTVADPVFEPEDDPATPMIKKSPRRRM